MAHSNGINRSAWILTLASVAVVVGALYLAKGILLPLILAGLISFLLSPACDWLEKHGLGRISAVLVTVSLTFIGLGIIASTAITQVGELAPKVAEYQGNIEAKVKLLTDSFGSTLRRFTSTTQKISEQIERAEHPPESTSRKTQPYSVRLITSPPTALEFFGGMFGTVLEGLATAGIVIILVLFFLARREDLRDRFIRLVGQGEVTGTTQALQDATNRISRYLLMQFLVNISFGVAAAVGLYWVGIPNAILWGIVTAALKFIPYIGVWIAALAPSCLSLAISTGWMQPLLAFSVFAVLEFFVGNFVEPILFGKHTGVSAVAIMVAAVFWSWLWGGIGLLLATPLTVCLLVLGKHVPQLQFLDILLGDEPVFDWKTRVYQRLLAGDQEEATELVERYLVEKSLVEVYDTLVIPVLCLAERDRHRGEIDVEHREFILQALRSMIEDLGEGQKQLAFNEVEEREVVAGTTSHSSKVTDTQAREIVCLAAFSEADEIVALMIAQLTEMRGALTKIISMRQFNQDEAESFEGVAAEMVCISTLPPAAVARARTACRKLRTKFPKTELIVGLWTYEGDVNRAAKRIGCNTTTRVATTLQAALESLFPLAESEAKTVPIPNSPDFGPIAMPAISR